MKFYGLYSAICVYVKLKMINCCRNSNLHIFKTIDMVERPTLYPVVPAKSVAAVDVNDGKTDIDLWSLLKDR